MESRENCLLTVTFLDATILLKHRRTLPTKFFGTLRQTTFDKKSWYSSPMHKIFQKRKLFETPKGSFTKIFGNVRQQISDGDSWYSIIPQFAPPPFRLVLINLSDTRKFLEHRRNPLRKLSVLWDNEFSTENRYTPALSPFPPSYS